MKVSQKLLDRYIESLYNMISDSYQPHQIIGVKRGGIKLSKPLSEKFNIKHSEIHISFYQNTNAADKPLKSDFIELDKDTLYLICDDLIDSGRTIEYVKTRYKDFNIKVATLLQNKKATQKADFFVDYYNGDWVYFSEDINQT